MSGDEATKTKKNPKQITSSGATASSSKGGLYSFHQLNSLAVIIVLSASGLVSFEDFGFLILASLYIFFIAKVAFPPNNQSDSPVLDPENKVFKLYVISGGVLGIFLPVAYIFEGIFEGDKEGIKAAAPHLFLLASQVFVEGVSFWGKFSIPIRVFVPVFFNSRRIFSLMEWVKSEMMKGDGSSRRVLVGRGLAAANMAFWSFNLFGFLLPLYLPRAFQKYYSKVRD